MYILIPTTSVLTLAISRERGVAGVLAGGCWLVPLDGVSHHEGGGRRCVGGVEHRGLRLRLHPHQRHGGTHPRAGERHHGAPVRHRPVVCHPGGAVRLHTV